MTLFSQFLNVLSFFPKIIRVTHVCTCNYGVKLIMILVKIIDSFLCEHSIVR